MESVKNGSKFFRGVVGFYGGGRFSIMLDFPGGKNLERGRRFMDGQHLETNEEM